VLLAHHHVPHGQRGKPSLREVCSSSIRRLLRNRYVPLPPMSARRYLAPIPFALENRGTTGTSQRWFGRLSNFGSPDYQTAGPAKKLNPGGYWLAPTTTAWTINYMPGRVLLGERYVRHCRPDCAAQYRRRDCKGRKVRAHSFVSSDDRCRPRYAECRMRHFPHDSSTHPSSALFSLETSEQSRDILSKKETTS
jgi:hypothetical protein